MKLYIASFTDFGQELAEKLGQKFGGTVIRCGKDGRTLSEFTAEAFENAEGIVYVGAAGIAVRAIAPHIIHKAVDPAVVVVDEAGKYAIPILSGHLGGANALAGKIAAFLDAKAVITTATDVRNVFAIDEWARVHKCAVHNPELIKSFSGKILRSGETAIFSEFPIEGSCPDGIVMACSEEIADAALTVHRQKDGILCVVPGIVVLGVGCRAGTSCEQIEKLYETLCKRMNLLAESVTAVATIDIKAHEPGLVSFCQNHGFALNTYSAEELNAVAGNFNASEFVRKTVGTDNVCERSAVLCSGGYLIHEKIAGNGVTMAAAIKPVCMDWSWKDE